MLGEFFLNFLNFLNSLDIKNTPCFRLTLGLMGLDELHLRVLATSSEDLREKRNAQKGKWMDLYFFLLCLMCNKFLS